MMFLAPGFLLASLGAAAAVVALHFIVTRQPRAGILPTARFVPDVPATAIARATRPSDFGLMLLRVLVVLATGTALAGPVVKESRVASARVILVDVSRSARSAPGLRDSALSVFRDGDAVILFDSSARRVFGNLRDSLSALTSSVRKGNLSGALITAMRAGSGMRERADSLELVIVSAFASEEIDAATDSIRALWPGIARIVRLVTPPYTVLRPGVSLLALKAAAADPLHVTVSLARRSSTAGSLIVRGAVFAADSLLASTEGLALIEWPAIDRPRGAISRVHPDTIGGVVANNELVVAGFERKWRFTSDSLGGAEIVARWIDGEPAAFERPRGKGCIRSIAVPVTAAGDLVIRDDFVRFVAAISGECTGRSIAPMTPAAVASSAGTGGMAPRGAFRPSDDVHSSLAPWLFALAIVAALAELFVRRRSRVHGVSGAPRPAPMGSMR